MGLEKELAQVINDLNKGGTKPYDTSAVVKRVEGNTAWVHIDQGVEETPVEMTIACKPGDTVKVRLSGGMAYLLGNNTAPPTDDRTALEALGTAGIARKMAKSAEKVANTTEQHTRPAITSMITYYKLSNGTPPQPTEENHAGWSEEEPEWNPESDEQLYYSVRSRTVQGVITWSNPHVLSSYANLNILQNAILLEVGEGSTVGFWLDSNGEPILDSNNEEIIATLGSITDAYARVMVKANEILQEVSETYVNQGTSSIQSMSSVMKQTAAGVDLYATINGQESNVHSHIDNDSFDIVKDDITVATFGESSVIGKVDHTVNGAKWIEISNEGIEGIVNYLLGDSYTLKSFFRFKPDEAIICGARIEDGAFWAGNGGDSYVFALDKDELLVQQKITLGQTSLTEAQLQRLLQLI